MDKVIFLRVSTSITLWFFSFQIHGGVQRQNYKKRCVIVQILKDVTATDYQFVWFTNISSYTAMQCVHLASTVTRIPIFILAQKGQVDEGVHRVCVCACLCGL